MEPTAGLDSEKQIVSILKVLSESSEPLGGRVIARELEQEGILLSERGVRYYLKIADLRGYTRPLGRDGRIITEAGRQEINEALAVQQLGSVRDRLEMLAYQTTFDPEKRTGKLSINTSLHWIKGVFSTFLWCLTRALQEALLKSTEQLKQKLMLSMMETMCTSAG